MPEPQANPSVEKGSESLVSLNSRYEVPPTEIWKILSRLGPGLIIAAAIVGSGELILTPKTGAQAGFSLLWLIILGCVIKVFVQVEFGRYAISSGKATMDALQEVPGPRLWGVRWILWYWLVMFTVSIAQLGGIVHGVGQSLAISLPITGDFKRLLEEQIAWDEAAWRHLQRLSEEEKGALSSQDPKVRQSARDRIKAWLEEVIGRPRPKAEDQPTEDDILWAGLVTLLTIALLVVGRYGLVQNVSAFLVAGFTGVTIFCVVALQRTEYAIRWTDLLEGLKGRTPRWEELTHSLMALVRSEPKNAVATALATFGIIGVGANELISYPYWCLEKGYARWTGPLEPGSAWAQRAQGWMRVMRWDAFLSMVIYTFATVAFYILGAAVLYPEGLDPEGNQMVYALSQPYVKVFGSWAHWVFLFGAFAVLYSTFFVANAGHALVATDAVRIFGLGAGRPETRWRWVKGFCVFLPSFALFCCLCIRRPEKLILASGLLQGIMLPMLAGATLYYRYRRCDQRIRPGRVWDLFLWLSALGMLVSGLWTAWNELASVLR
ncbi:MAG: Nramp family divalent metal transporter [Thermoguttaceae bacterium]|nr:Nramp family divalent metal transporter [Thermoguttaceae bacterium]MDW8036479.1 Nramp family divalent metal transporter [Thermoguttaceae bacterium]